MGTASPSTRPAKRSSRGKPGGKRAGDHDASRTSDTRSSQAAGKDPKRRTKAR